MDEQRPLLGDQAKASRGGVHLSKCGIVVIILACFIIGAGVGVMVAIFALPDTPEEAMIKKLNSEANPDVRDRLFEEIKADNIRNYLRELTEHPHLAGTPADKEQADDLARFWEDNGIKSVVVPYNVLLSYPDPDNPNRIELQDGSGQSLHTTQLEEKILRPDQGQPDVVPPFGAYSAAGTPRGDLIFVNYGRIDDFIWLSEEKNIDFNNKICIAKYGKIYRGDKVKHAQAYGAAGLIVFSDPKDYALPGYEVYPDGWMLPGTGVQRGSYYLDDNRSPGYPDIDSSYAIDEEDTAMPRIPVHPIGYDDAYHLLRDMTGEDAPADWQGGLNFTYKLGPGYTDTSSKVQMFISTSNQNATTYDVVGFIEGCIEPDRYVVIGNHRDAWVFGGIDPSTGTAVMKELSRAMAKLVKEGWCPRRTIIFCSWGAEEYALIGSREWVDQFGHILGDRAVAYLNLDSAVDGNVTLDISAMPMLSELIKDSAKTVPSPHGAGQTLYDVWLAKNPELDSEGKSTGNPRIDILGSGSDYEAFVGKVGVTSADFSYTYDPTLGLSSNPLYHSAYESFYYFSTYVDPDFKVSKSMGQFMGELIRRLADDQMINFTVVDHSSAVEQYIQSLVSQYGDVMMDNGLGEAVDYLNEAVEKFKAAAEDFDGFRRSIDRSNPVEVRQVNDQIMLLDRKFIDPLGLPGRPLARNIVFAPSSQDSYAGSSFPGLADTLFRIDTLTGAEENARWEEVARQLSIVTFFIDNAAAALQPPTEFHAPYNNNNNNNNN